ncbi:MAG: hypothetical protein ACK44O_10225 [Novosphingobium sp.]|jgi:hypothetical protein|uniref:hypothetical protein n=1 Tax=Novosphingobium sp. TaxID=1874826 RepID=UPI00391AD160|nr:hypothetical protein [Novosphingobium sp.]
MALHKPQWRAKGLLLVKPAKSQFTLQKAVRKKTFSAVNLLLTTIRKIWLVNRDHRPAQIGGH